jgi:hypothetical protein
MTLPHASQKSCGISEIESKRKSAAGRRERFQRFRQRHCSKQGIECRNAEKGAQRMQSDIVDRLTARSKSSPVPRPVGMKNKAARQTVAKCNINGDRLPCLKRTKTPTPSQTTPTIDKKMIDGVQRGTESMASDRQNRNYRERISGFLK